jgi:hypothetical protein
MATMSIPLLLKDLTGGARQAEVAGQTLAEVIAALDAIHPGIQSRIHDGQKINPTLAFVVDGKIATRGLATPVGPHSQVNILPTFGGG